MATWKYMVIFLVVLLLTVSMGCVTNPLLAPADMLINDTVGPEYEKYVNADATLSERDRRYRLENVKAFRELIRRYKEDAEWK